MRPEPGPHRHPFPQHSAGKAWNMREGKRGEINGTMYRIAVYTESTFRVEIGTIQTNEVTG